MLPPRRSSPARSTASAASIPASPQPSTLAASRPARRPSPPARPGAPPPSPPGPGGDPPPASPCTAGRALQIAPLHLRDLPDQIPEPLVLGHLPAGLRPPATFRCTAGSARPPCGSRFHCGPG